MQDFFQKSFATLQEINELRHKEALQITVRLNHLSELHTQHIPHIPHAPKARLPKELATPPDEDTILVERMVRKTSANMGNNRRQVLILMERGDKRSYQEWLTQQQEAEQITQTQAKARWSSFLNLPMVTRQTAQARQAAGRHIF
jgi:hypothetical protein